MAVTQTVRFQFEHADVSASNLERRDHDFQLQHFLSVFLGFILGFEALVGLWTTIVRHQPEGVQ